MLADISEFATLSLPPRPASDWLALHHVPSASVVDQIGMSGTFMEERGWDVAGVVEATRDHRVCHTGLEPRTSRQGPTQVCYSHV